MNLKAIFARSGMLVLLEAAPLLGQSITSFSPSVGSPGDTIMINGNGFIHAAGITVQFWNKKSVVSGYISSDSQMTVVVPNGTTTGPISVHWTGGQTNFSSYDFTAIGHGPFITGFNPAYAAANDPNSIQIFGVHFTNVQVRFNGTLSTSAQADAAGQTITTFLPSGASTGPISVTTAYGTSNSPTSFVVVPLQQPYVASFSPSSGNPGEPVSLVGLGFTGATAVQFNGTNAGFIPPTSDTTLTAYVPGGAMSGPITVINAYGSSTSADIFYLQPQVMGFSPAAAPPRSSVVITGRSFTNAFAVTFNGTPALFAPNSNTQIVAQVPDGATTGPVRVKAPGGQSPPSDDFIVLPLVTGFTPSAGAVGTNVTITGQNLLGATEVTFGGGANVAPQNVTYTQLVATVPASATSGPILVTTTNGTASSTANFYLPPSLTGFTPTNGTPDLTVTITGNNFTDASSVTFGSFPAKFVVTNNTTIGVVVPDGVSTGPISVSTPAGTVGSGSQYFYVPPEINSFLPVHGLPGTNVTLFGNNFLGATEVRFNGALASFVKPTNNLTLQATVPGGATTGPISVKAPAGTAFSAAPFTLDYASDLAVSASAAPDPVYVGSNLTYTISVTNAGPFDAPNAVLTNTLPASVTIQSVTNSAGTLGTNGSSVVLTLGTFYVSTSATLTLVVVPHAAGPITNRVVASSGYPDPTPFNNTNTLATTVLPPPPPPPAPVLNIEPYASTLLKITWPAALSNYDLQFAPALGNRFAWSNLTTAPFVSGTNNIVIEPGGEPARFYRLKQ